MNISQYKVQPEVGDLKLLLLTLTRSLEPNWQQKWSKEGLVS